MPLEWGGIWVWDNGQAGLCMGGNMGWCMTWRMVMCCWGIHKWCVILLRLGGGDGWTWSLGGPGLVLVMSLMGYCPMTWKILYLGCVCLLRGVSLWGDPAVTIFNRQRARQTDRQTNRQTGGGSPAASKLLWGHGRRRSHLSHEGRPRSHQSHILLL